MITAAKKNKNPFKSIYYIVVAGFVLTIHDGIIKWISHKSSPNTPSLTLSICSRPVAYVF